MHTLIPFTETSLTSLFTFSVSYARPSPEAMVVNYNIHGPVHKILLAKESHTKSIPQVRLDELWKHTCFEAFLCETLEPQAPYVEINCSPQGHWNAYSFSSYRQNMTPAKNITVSLAQLQVSPQDLRAQVCISGHELPQMRHLGVTAVLEFTDLSKAYFALKHPAPQADFHAKEAFLISL